MIVIIVIIHIVMIIMVLSMLNSIVLVVGWLVSMWLVNGVGWERYMVYLLLMVWSLKSMLKWSDWSVVMSPDMKMVWVILMIVMMILFCTVVDIFSMVIWKSIEHMMESWSIQAVNFNIRIMVSWDIFMGLMDWNMNIFSPVMSWIISFTCVGSVMHLSSHSVIVVY